MPKYKRIVPFVLSLMGLFYYFTGLGYEIYKVSSGETWKDSVEEIFFAYVLWIATPTAIIETSYVTLMALRSKDLDFL